MSVTDIFVGGAGDRFFKCAKTYADQFAHAHPERQVIYLAQFRRRQLRQLLDDQPNAQRVNLIGHSWGAADVAWAERREACEQAAGRLLILRVV